MTRAGDHVTSQQFMPQAGPRPARHLINPVFPWSSSLLFLGLWVSLVSNFPFVSTLGGNPLNYV
jgi:hypothetical protein